MYGTATGSSSAGAIDFSATNGGSVNHGDVAPTISSASLSGTTLTVTGSWAEARIKQLHR